MAVSTAKLTFPLVGGGNCCPFCGVSSSGILSEDAKLTIAISAHTGQHSVRYLSHVRSYP